MSSATSSAGPRLALGIAAIVAAVFALSLGDAAIKALSANLVATQLFVLRSGLILVALYLCLRIWAPGALRMPPALGWIITRSLLMAAMWVVYYVALTSVDLSIAAAAYYAGPIFITLLSAVFLRHRINALGWLAVMLGFVGVLLVLQPNASDFNAMALLPLVSALLYAVAMIITTAKCQAVHPLILSAGLNLAFVLVGGLAVLAFAYLYAGPRDGFLMGEWSALDRTGWLAILALAAALFIGSIGAAVAYLNGPPPIIACFDFSYVAFAAAWGVIFFSETLDTWTLAGMGLIVLAGILSLRGSDDGAGGGT